MDLYFLRKNIGVVFYSTPALGTASTVQIIYGQLLAAGFLFYLLKAMVDPQLAMPSLYRLSIYFCCCCFCFIETTILPETLVDGFC